MATGRELWSVTRQVRELLVIGKGSMSLLEDAARTMMRCMMAGGTGRETLKKQGPNWLHVRKQ